MVISALAKLVAQVTQPNDFLGYDRLSFEVVGAERPIEVKATTGRDLRRETNYGMTQPLESCELLQVGGGLGPRQLRKKAINRHGFARKCGASSRDFCNASDSVWGAWFNDSEGCSAAGENG